MPPGKCPTAQVSRPARRAAKYSRRQYDGAGHHKGVFAGDGKEDASAGEEQGWPVNILKPLGN